MEDLNQGNTAVMERPLRVETEALAGAVAVGAETVVVSDSGLDVFLAEVLAGAGESTSTIPAFNAHI